MTTTIHSSKGQLIIPKQIRMVRSWEAGQELEVVAADEGVLQNPRAVVPGCGVPRTRGFVTRDGKKFSHIKRIRGAGIQGEVGE